MADAHLNKIVICHVVYRFATGGLENGLVNLINHLPENDYQHIIVTLQGHDEEFAKRLNKEVAIYNVEKKPGKDIAVFWRMFKLFRCLKPDVLHTRNLATLEAQVMGWLARVPYRIHGEHGWDVNDPKGTEVKYQKLRRFVGRFVHRFVPLSSELENYLTSKALIPVNKINRICNGVDLNRFKVGVTAPANSSGSENNLTFGCVGRLAKIKGHDFLFSAFHHFFEKYPTRRDQVRLLMVGDGEERSALESKAQSLNISNQISFLGNQSNIPKMMQDFDVFVLPSLAEGISNTILEAMASALPVIATDVGGNRDLVSDGQTGLIIPSEDQNAMADAMEKMAKDTDLRQQYAQAGIERVNKLFSLDVMVGHYDRLYKQVVRFK